MARGRTHQVTRPAQKENATVPKTKHCISTGGKGRSLWLWLHWPSEKR